MPIAPSIGVDETDGLDVSQDAVPAPTDAAVQAALMGNDVDPSQ
jgi:hypothetical protein